MGIEGQDTPEGLLGPSVGQDPFWAGNEGKTASWSGLSRAGLVLRDLSFLSVSISTSFVHSTNGLSNFILSYIGIKLYPWIKYNHFSIVFWFIS